MTKSPDAFRTISEVADWLGIQAHVLRFWESKFSQVKPVKRAGGRRYYRPADMQLLGGIKQLLYEDGLTIKGVQKILREQGTGHVAAMSAPLSIDSDLPGEDADDSAVLPFPDAQAGGELAGEPDAAQALAETAEDPAPAPSEAEPAAEQTTDAAESTTATPEQGEQEELPLPSFARRRNEDPAEPSDAARSESPQEPPAPAAEPVALVVDAPDPPDEADLPYEPGILAILAKTDQLDARQAQAIQPALRALDDWVESLSGAA